MCSSATIIQKVDSVQLCIRFTIGVPCYGCLWQAVKHHLDIKVSCEYLNIQKWTKTGPSTAFHLCLIRQQLREETTVVFSFLGQITLH